MAMMMVVVMMIVVATMPAMGMVVVVVCLGHTRVVANRDPCGNRFEKFALVVDCAPGARLRYLAAPPPVPVVTRLITSGASCRRI